MRSRSPRAARGWASLEHPCCAAPSGMIGWFAGVTPIPGTTSRRRWPLTLPVTRGGARCLPLLISVQRTDGAWHAYYAPMDRSRRPGSTQRALLRRERPPAPLRHQARPVLLEEGFAALEAALGYLCSLVRPSGTSRGVSMRTASRRGLSSRRELLDLQSSGGARAGGLPRRETRSVGAPFRLAPRRAHAGRGLLDKDEFAMDWYYPVLAGCVEGLPRTAS